jgi:hypothetical protein
MFWNKKKNNNKNSPKKTNNNKGYKEITKAGNIYIVLKSYLILELKIHFHLYNFICEY